VLFPTHVPELLRVSQCDGVVGGAMFVVNWYSGDVTVVGAVVV
jgi:hypothetical protein